MTGEEYGATGKAPRTWLVDPLCGTLNFAAQTPLFSVNVALQSPAATVGQPLTGEIFWTNGTTANLRRKGADSPATPSASSPSLVRATTIDGRDAEDTWSRMLAGVMPAAPDRVKHHYG